MSVVLKPRYTPEQYLDIERAADYKSEYFDGEIFAMAGASEEHNTITFNLSGALVPQLRGTGCRGYAGDMRVKVDASGLYTYPDVVVVCGERHFTDDHLDTLTNPTLIIEVLSPSTEGYDRGQKFANYRRIPSLETYVLVAQERAHIEKFERRPDGQWLLSEASDLTGTLPLPSIGCTLVLAEVYDNVSFPPPAPPQDGAEDAARSR
jgi:Uma2 family endonuclease